MIDRKAALLRVITCAIGGAVLLPVVSILRSYTVGWLMLRFFISNNGF